MLTRTNASAVRRHPLFGFAGALSLGGRAASHTGGVKWIPSRFSTYEGLDVSVRLLRGWKMRSVDALMSEFGAALQFLEAFGENWWYALVDNDRFARPAVPFHILLNLSPDRPATQGRITEAARVAGVTIDVAETSCSS